MPQIWILFSRLETCVFPVCGAPGPEFMHPTLSPWDKPAPETSIGYRFQVAQRKERLIVISTLFLDGGVTVASDHFCSSMNITPTVTCAVLCAMPFFH
jgi:hypothetical protein